MGWPYTPIEHSTNERQGASWVHWFSSDSESAFFSFGTTFAIVQCEAGFVGTSDDAGELWLPPSFSTNNINKTVGSAVPGTISSQPKRISSNAYHGNINGSNRKLLQRSISYSQNLFAGIGYSQFRIGTERSLVAYRGHHDAGLLERGEIREKRKAKS